jgi:glycerol-3-phosphate dehydrogenase
MQKTHDIIIIGGGVIGSAMARELARYQLSVLVLEKEGDVAEGISKANSGVIHAGFNVPYGSLKAKFNVEGLLGFPRLAEILDVPYKLTQKLVVAKDKQELPYLKKLLEQGHKNGCPGLSIIEKDRILTIQPDIEAEYALFSEKTAVICPFTLTIALAENAHQNGARFLFYADVVDIQKPAHDLFQIKLHDQRVFRSKMVINCAGNHADKIAALIEKDPQYKIYPVRGEYFILDSENNETLKTAIYPVPPKDGRGLGIHLTPTINGNILIGPSAESVDECTNACNTKIVMEQLKKEAYELLPALKNIDIIKSYAGIRPKLFKPGDNKNFADFVIEESPEVRGLINLIGIESPGLTSAPAIAKHVVENIVARSINLKPKENFIAERKGIKRAKFMPHNELQNLAAIDKNYTNIICRCEQISKAEIIQAINNPLGTKTLNAIKKRTHAMMGRCQSGFCLPKISAILIEEMGLHPNQLVKNHKNSNLLMENPNETI